MIISQEIKNEVYEKFIEYAFKRCDAVMFAFNTYFKEDKEETTKIKEKLMKYKKSFIIEKDKSLDKTIIYRDGMTVAFYKTTEDIKEYLLSNKSLYNWERPTDLSFFKRGKCFMRSVAHEDMCDIYCENKEEYEYLKKIGIRFLDTEYEETPKEYLIFEEY